MHTYSFIRILWPMKRNHCSLELPSIHQCFWKIMLRMKKILQIYHTEAMVGQKKLSILLQYVFFIFSSKLHQHFYDYGQMQIFYHLALTHCIRYLLWIFLYTPFYFHRLFQYLYPSISLSQVMLEVLLISVVSVFMCSVCFHLNFVNEIRCLWHNRTVML